MTQANWAIGYEQQPLQLLCLDLELQAREEEREGTCRRGRRFSLCWDNDDATSQHRKWHWKLCHRGDEWEVLIIPQQREEARLGQARPGRTVGSRNRLKIVKYQSVVIMCNTAAALMAKVRLGVHVYSCNQTRAQHSLASNSDWSTMKAVFNGWAWA